MTQEFVDSFKDFFIPFSFLFGFNFGFGLFAAQYVFHTFRYAFFQFLDWLSSRKNRKTNGGV